jgi:hypothetical protein
MILSPVIAPEWTVMADLVAMNQIVVDQQILMDGRPGAQIQVVLRIRKSHHYHSLIFTRGMI